jgi:hypothetical protein
MPSLLFAAAAKLDLRLAVSACYVQSYFCYSMSFVW